MTDRTIEKRYRVNVSISTKGVKTYDCTVEISGPDIDKFYVLSESDSLVAELDKRYPVPVEK